MVLEDSISSSEPSTYDTNASNFDGSFEQVRHNIDISSLPRPLPILGPLLGFGNERFKRLVAKQLRLASTILGRPPSNEETNAFAFWAAKELKVMSYGVPLGLGAGLWRAYSTRESWRYPFWKVGENFDPSSVNIPRVGEILRGQAARTFHQLARTSLYGSNGVILGFLLVAPYAASVGAVGTLRDPRLKEFVEATVRRAKEEQQRHNTGGNRNTRGPKQGRKAESDTWNDQRASSEGSDTGFEDASPSGGQSMDDFQSTEYSGQSSNTYPGDSVSQTSQPLPRRTDSSTGTSRSRTARKPTTQSDSSDGFFSDDDASPTSSQSSQSSPAVGGSAWERLRRGASNPQTTTYGDKRSPQQQGEENRGGDGYTFSGAEEQKQLAKDEAQKDFDARLEKERLGGDFGGAGGRRNW